jgi:hypothetical protein
MLRGVLPLRPKKVMQTGNTRRPSWRRLNQGRASTDQRSDARRSRQPKQTGTTMLIIPLTTIWLAGTLILVIAGLVAGTAED